MYVLRGSAVSQGTVQYVDDSADMSTIFNTVSQNTDIAFEYTTVV